MVHIDPKKHNTILADAVWRLEAQLGHVAFSARYHQLPRRIEDDYTITTEVLGSGMNGKVMSAIRKGCHSGQMYAVKSFSLKQVALKKRKQFAAEAELFLCMDHPNVCRLYDVYESSDYLHLVMEQLDGGELFDRIKTQKVFSEHEAAEASGASQPGSEAEAERLQGGRSETRCSWNSPAQANVTSGASVSCGTELAQAEYAPASFADCRTHNGKVYPTYEETLRATGQFVRDDEAHAVLDELIALRYTAAQLRFAFLVLLEQDAAPVSLYRKYERPLMKGFLDRATWLQNGNSDENWKLGEITDGAPADATAGPPSDTTTPTPTPTTALLARIRQCPGQRTAYDHILTCCHRRREAFVFVEGRAGTGKTTLATCLTQALEADGPQVLNVAATGQAALLQPHGATAHSAFAIPVHDDAELTCSLSMTSAQAITICKATLIQWDEFPSARKAAWDAVIALLRALADRYPDTYVPKTFVGYGDFRQIPPVVPKGTRQSIVSSSVRSSASWPQFAIFTLDRVHRQADDRHFAAWLDTIGSGDAPTITNHTGSPGYIKLHDIATVPSEDDALKYCFPAPNDPHQCAESKVLAVLNSLVDAYNERMLNLLVRTYQCPSYRALSADTLDIDAAGAVEQHITAEFLNLQTSPGAPPHCLHLVEGALYELMRNFNPKDRLMNRVPVILRKVHTHHVLIETLDGRAFPLPRITFRWQIVNGTSTMARRQYPLRPAYASTYNSAQGRTLSRMVLDVRHNPFSHGHLYAALTRVRHRSDIRALASPDHVDTDGWAIVKNTVWPELLLAVPTKSSRRLAQP
ncbi:unnamed protein product [Prorocentrum cordatum]|uniref:ATP-dependent DNA helicase n=1 Tax=Prorocentrum cordatum TaxID=2364126 RepID=A0ABN9Q1S9_9DINO|nr:unnamed protein product [Polarella glacialis]